MGRGREKAKQQRLGRSMKYNLSEPDFDALTDELHRAAASEARAAEEKRSKDAEPDRR